MSGPNLHVLKAEPLGEGIIDHLEGALKRARDGELSSCAIALVYRDGSVGHVWSRAPSFTALVGSIARMQHAIIEEANAD